jgi:cell fate regulator YaaT (PSP1 superfamily)
MAKVAGISFKSVGKIYWFNPHHLSVQNGDQVVVETVRGLELGTVVDGPKEIDESQIEHELKPIVRIASKNDLKTYQENIAKAPDAMKKCKEIVKRNKLQMKLLECEFTLDKQKIIIYYNAEGRVDFRELLKDLAQEFRLRIELRQVGPREGAKFIGGLGPCGLVVCCKSHLREFDLVTMKMAKDQGMSLSATKVAGLCGKLMCCIAYENPLYEEIRARVPAVGDLVRTPTCASCRVVDVNYMRELVKTTNEDKIEEWPATDIVKIKSQEQKVSPDDLSDDVLED